MEEEMFDAENVGIGKGNPNGYAWVAPKGTKLPADAKEAIPDGFVSLGYVNDEGVVNSTEADSSDIKDWAGRVIKKVQNSFSETYQVGFLEGRTSVLKTYYGDENVEDDGKGSVTVRHNGAFTEERSFVIETLLTETVIKRTVIPRGCIYDRDDVEHNSENPVVYKATITALPDASGNTSYDYYYNTATGSASDPVDEG